MEKVYFGKCYCLSGDICPCRRFIINDVNKQRVVEISVCAEFFRLIMQDDQFASTRYNNFREPFLNAILYIVNKVGIEYTILPFFSKCGCKSLNRNDFYARYFLVVRPKIVAQIRIDEAIDLIFNCAENEIITHTYSDLTYDVICLLNKVKKLVKLKTIHAECDKLCNILEKGVRYTRYEEGLIYRINSVLISYLNKI